MVRSRNQYNRIPHPALDSKCDTKFTFCKRCFYERNVLTRPHYDYFCSAIMLVTYFVNFRQLNDYLFGKELFIRLTASAFRKLLSIYVFSYFPFGSEDRMWDLIVSVPDHCLSFYFSTKSYLQVTKTYFDLSTLNENIYRDRI